MKLGNPIKSGYHSNVTVASAESNTFNENKSCIGRNLFEKLITSEDGRSFESSNRRNVTEMFHILRLENSNRMMIHQYDYELNEYHSNKKQNLRC